MEKMSNNEIAVESALDLLSPEKKAALNAALNLKGEDTENVKNMLEYFADEGDFSAIQNLNGLIEQFNDCPKEQERAIGMAISTAIS